MSVTVVNGNPKDFVNVDKAQTITGSKTFQAGSATAVPLTVSATTGQTANIVEIRSATGDSLFRVRSGGGVAIAGDPLSETGGMLSITSPGGGDTGLTVRGAIGQTANLQTWQDSTGTALAYIEGSVGAVRVKHVDAMTNVWVGISGTGTNDNLVKLRARAAAAQTEHLLQTENSSGGANSWIAANGNIFGSANINAGNDVKATQLYAQPGPHGDALYYGAMVNVTTVDANRKGIAVRASASQVANFAEFQNSAGTAVGVITADGSWRGTGFRAEVINEMATSYLVIHVSGIGDRRVYAGPADSAGTGRRRLEIAN